MNALKIGIVEDELIIAESIKMSLQSMGYTVPEPACSFEEAIKMIEREKPDMLLLDINLKGNKDGTEIARILRKYAIPFIYLTAYSDSLTLSKAKETFPAAYIVKPFQKDDLYATIEVAMNNFNRISADINASNRNSPINAIFIKDGNCFHKVPFDDILYIASDHVYVCVVLKNKRKFLVRSSLLKYYEQFDKNVFFRLGRSHIINLKHIDGIYTSHVDVTGHTIPLGKNYRADLLSRVKISS